MFDLGEDITLVLLITPLNSIQFKADYNASFFLKKIIYLGG